MPHIYLFICDNPNSPLIEHTYHIDYSNYKNIKELNRYFSKIYDKVEKKTEPFSIVTEKIKTFLKKHYIIIFSIVSPLFLLLVLIAMGGIPIQTINFEALSFSISTSILKYSTIPIISTFFILMTTIIIKIIFFMFTTKEQFIKYSDIRKTNTLTAVIPLLITISAMYLLLSIIEFSNKGKSGIIDEIIKTYISKTQVPSILKIKDKTFLTQDSNSSNTILYLGIGNTFNYFSDKDINKLISKDESLYKDVCMGNERGYITDLIPLLNKGTFENSVHRKSMKKDFIILPDTIGFKEAFCYVTFPRIIKRISKDKNETVLLMGIKKEQDKNRFGITINYIKDRNTSYYYSELQIRKALKNNAILKNNLDNPELWIQDMMKTEALKKEPYQRLENANFKKINDINLSKEFLLQKGK